MADIFKMPKLGETVTKGTVSRWLLAVGDSVNFDDPLLEISTDKVDSEIPSPYAGTLLEILVPEGETVDVGAPLARIGLPAEAPVPSDPPAVALPLNAPAAAQPNGSSLSATPIATPVPASSPSASPLPPVAAASPPVAAALAPPPAPSSSTTVGSKPLLSPVVRKLAAEHGVDLAIVKGSGAGGRIMREDVEAAIAAAGRNPRDEEAAAAVASRNPRDEVQAMSRIRMAVAERMTESLRVAPHVWSSVEVDMQAVEEVRSRHKERFRSEEGISLTYLPFVARAVCDALRAVPAVNSSVDMQAKTITLHHYVHLGIAVDLSEQGLTVPVIRDADGLSLRGLARAIRAAADKVRSGQAAIDDLTGSTFTITNPGPLGDYASMPIINQPNAAILSTNMVSRRPTAVGDAIAVHYMTILGFSYDHRAFDGVTGSRFLAHVRDALQTRDWGAELG
jgi:pyruvate dehydrogenase E2 component (dihydrolipoamide acetyltransferase)